MKKFKQNILSQHQMRFAKKRISSWSPDSSSPTKRSPNKHSHSQLSLQHYAPFSIKQQIYKQNRFLQFNNSNLEKSFRVNQGLKHQKPQLTFLYFNLLLIIFDSLIEFEEEHTTTTNDTIVKQQYNYNWFYFIKAMSILLISTIIYQTQSGQVMCGIDNRKQQIIYAFAWLGIILQNYNVYCFSFYKIGRVGIVNGLTLFYHYFTRFHNFKISIIAILLQTNFFCLCLSKNLPFLYCNCYAIFSLVVLYLLEKEQRIDWIQQHCVSKNQAQFNIFFNSHCFAQCVIDSRGFVELANAQANILLEKYKLSAQQSFQAQQLQTWPEATKMEKGQNIKLMNNKNKHQNLLLNSISKRQSSQSRLPPLDCIEFASIIHNQFKQDFVLALSQAAASAQIPVTVRISIPQLQQSQQQQQEQTKNLEQQQQNQNISVQFECTVSAIKVKGKSCFLLVIKEIELSSPLTNHFTASHSMNCNVAQNARFLAVTLESDFEKWNNLQRVSNNEVLIKQQDLQKLAEGILVIHRLLLQIGQNQTLNKSFLGIEEGSSLPFNVKHAVIHCFDLAFIQEQDNNYELQLSFEPTFPDIVSGNQSAFEQMVLLCLKVLLSGKSNKKNESTTTTTTTTTTNKNEINLSSQMQQSPFNGASGTQNNHKKQIKQLNAKCLLTTYESETQKWMLQFDFEVVDSAEIDQKRLQQFRHYFIDDDGKEPKKIANEDLNIQKPQQIVQLRTNKQSPSPQKVKQMSSAQHILSSKFSQFINKLRKMDGDPDSNSAFILENLEFLTLSQLISQSLKGAIEFAVHPTDKRCYSLSLKLGMSLTSKDHSIIKASQTQPLNKFPLSYTFCRIAKSTTQYQWKEKQAAIMKPSKQLKNNLISLAGMGEIGDSQLAQLLNKKLMDQHQVDKNQMGKAIQALRKDNLHENTSPRFKKLQSQVISSLQELDSQQGAHTQVAIQTEVGNSTEKEKKANYHQHLHQKVSSAVLKTHINFQEEGPTNKDNDKLNIAKEGHNGIIDKQEDIDDQKFQSIDSLYPVLTNVNLNLQTNPGIIEQGNSLFDKESDVCQNKFFIILDDLLQEMNIRVNYQSRSDKPNIIDGSGGSSYLKKSNSSQLYIGKKPVTDSNKTDIRPQTRAMQQQHAQSIYNVQQNGLLNALEGQTHKSSMQQVDSLLTPFSKMHIRKLQTPNPSKSTNREVFFKEEENINSLLCILGNGFYDNNTNSKKDNLSSIIDDESQISQQPDQDQSNSANSKGLSSSLQQAANKYEDDLQMNQRNLALLLPISLQPLFLHSNFNIESNQISKNIFERAKTHYRHWK